MIIVLIKLHVVDNLTSPRKTTMNDSKFPFAMYYSNLMASITKPRALVAANLYSSNERTQTTRPLGGHSIHSKLLYNLLSNSATGWFTFDSRHHTLFVLADKNDMWPSCLITNQQGTVVGRLYRIFYPLSCNFLDILDFKCFDISFRLFLFFIHFGTENGIKSWFSASRLSQTSQWVLSNLDLMMKQEAIGVSEFQRLFPFFLSSSCAPLYPSSRLLVVSFHPVSTLRQAIPILRASKLFFSSSCFVYPYLFRRFLLDMIHWKGLGDEIVLFWLYHFRSISLDTS